MKTLKIIILFAIIFSPLTAFSQLTISNGNHVLEISGRITTYFNYRFMKPGEENLRKNRFKLADAQLEIEGRIGKDIEYELQIDFADIASGVRDPEEPGILDANITYKGLEVADVTLGFGKTPYSRSSIVPSFYSPYLQRSEFLRGDIFARRDVGITLSKNFWRQRITMYAGVYTGLGEISLSGDNDPSGRMEYIGRLEAAYPSRYRYREIDTRHVPIPMFVVGFNGRYSNKKLPTGTTFPPSTIGEYGIKVIDGERYVIGADASFQFKGFSAQFEIHRMKAMPQNSRSVLYQGYPESLTGGYFLMGGMIAQANYYVKDLNLILSGRYEEYNLNDLAPGLNKRFSAALGYQLNGFNSMIKAQFTHIIEEESIDILRWKNQLRIGWQLLFR